MSWFKKEVKCNYESSTGDCNLVQKLRELQEEKRKIDKQIEIYKTNNMASAQKFIEFLCVLEKNGLFQFCRYAMFEDNMSGIRTAFNSFGTTTLEKSVKSFSDGEIQMFCNELKSMKHKSELIEEYRVQSNKLSEEIKAIKDTLGIE